MGTGNTSQIGICKNVNCAVVAIIMICKICMEDPFMDNTYQGEIVPHAPTAGLVVRQQLELCASTLEILDLH